MTYATPLGEGILTVHVNRVYQPGLSTAQNFTAAHCRDIPPLHTVVIFQISHCGIQKNEFNKSNFMKESLQKH